MMDNSMKRQDGIDSAVLSTTALFDPDSLPAWSTSSKPRGFSSLPAAGYGDYDALRSLLDSAFESSIPSITTDLFEPVPLMAKSSNGQELLEDLVDEALDQIDADINADSLLNVFEPLPLIDNKRFIITEHRSIKRRRLTNSASSHDGMAPRFRPYQQEQWDAQFQELLAFKEKEGHCCVPHSFEENPTLARWVKRQRYQYKRRQEGKASTITAHRINLLEEIGFVWDSHSAAWEERLNELRIYCVQNGHCSVPSTSSQYPQLATWVKCQRRQYKRFCAGLTSSNITAARISALDHLGFAWDARGSRNA